MRKTMRKVTTVVPVLMTSCQVSLKLKIGPVTAQVTTTAVARKKMAGFPQKSEAWAGETTKPSRVLGYMNLCRICFVLLHAQTNCERSVKACPAKPGSKG